MTALTVPARPPDDDSSLRPVPWRRMAGVTWRQQIYAHCIDGQADAANQRITDALGTKDTKPEPGGEEDGHSEKAS